MFKYVLNSIFFIFIISAGFAQTYKYDDEELETIMESIAKRSNKSDIIDRIETFINNPLNLAESSVGKIARIPTITYTMAKDIKNLVRKGLNITEIIDSLNLDKEKAYLLEYCTYIDRSITAGKTKLKLQSRSRCIEQFNILKGFEDNKFQGNIADLYQRILSEYGNYSLGFLFSKDLGEKYSNSFLSGFASASFGSFRIGIGDFYVQTGLGNIMWSQNTMGKSAEIISPAFQFDNSIYNYKSASEFGFFRGISLANSFHFTSKSSLTVSTWAAKTPRNATVGKNDSITSLYRAGLFRTESEIRKQNSADEKSVGGNITFSHQSLNFGIAALFLEYDRPVNTSSSFAIRGANALLSTVYAVIPLEPFTFSAEVSSDGRRNMAYKFITELKKNDYLFILHGRSFAAAFRSPYGYMFGEQSNPANEYGLYCGVLYKGWKNVRMGAYLDYFGTYTNTYYLPLPMHGIEFLSQTVIKIDKRELRFRLKYENKTDGKTIKNDKKVFQRSKYYARADYILYPSNQLKFRTRVDFNIVNFESVLPGETGFAAYFESQYKFSELLKLSGRLAYFSTDSYESAIWQYEYTIPGYLYMPPLYGSGFRAFLSLNCKPLKQLSLWARFVIMKKNNASTIGSGYNKIMGSVDKRLYLQVDFKL